MLSALKAAVWHTTRLPFVPNNSFSICVRCRRPFASVASPREGPQEDGIDADQTPARKKRMFVDTAYITVRGGAGGMGGASYGGTGGDGGSVYIEAVHRAALPGKGDAKKFFADGGGNSSRVQGRRGKTAADTVIKVPAGTCVLDDSGRTIADLDTPGQRVLVAQGGKGGSMFTVDYQPTKGEHRAVKLVLKSIADIGLVGFPNAGKSTLLHALSKAQPKVADYPFTTLRPNLGVMECGDETRLTIADIPGLVEGAHANLGMGHKFLRHIERTKGLIYVIDIGGFRLSQKACVDPMRTAHECFVLLQRELELYQDGMLDRPSILVINKMDTPGAEALRQEFDVLLQLGPTRDSMKVRAIHYISAAHGHGLEGLRQSISSWFTARPP